VVRGCGVGDSQAGSSRESHLLLRRLLHCCQWHTVVILHDIAVDGMEMGFLIADEEGFGSGILFDILEIGIPGNLVKETEFCHLRLEDGNEKLTAPYPGLTKETSDHDV